MLVKLEIKITDTEVILVQMDTEYKDTVVMAKSTAIQIALDILYTYDFNEYSTLKAIEQTVKHLK
jgi:hypothetical protein